MALTITRQGGRLRGAEAGTANTQLVSTHSGEKGDLLMVTCKYSAAPTQAGVTVTLDSGAGAAYDVVLNTGSANAQTTVWQPSAPVPFFADDAIVVTAPAGGAVITASVTIYTNS
jgi:hypothetical protein